jgi:pimeloyl-ACP methyl ester carboxylesterase
MMLVHGTQPSPYGPMHYVECGSGAPVLLLHQTPRSWTEYLDVLPLIGAHHRAIALDTLGFGDSARPAGPLSIELFADGVDAVLAGLGVDRFHLAGHHTGGVIAVEVAARHPDRVASLVLSAASFVDEERRRTSAGRPPIDLVTPRPDGSHLIDLWNRRRRFYHDGEEAALHRFVVDAVKVLDRVEEGHEAVHRYRMEERIGAVRAPSLAICGEEDHYSLPSLEKFAKALRCETVVVPGAGVPMPEQQPERFAQLVMDTVALA